MRVEPPTFSYLSPWWRDACIVVFVNVLFCLFDLSMHCIIVYHLGTMIDRWINWRMLASSERGCHSDQSWRWWLMMLKMEPANSVLISYQGKPRCITPIFQHLLICCLCIKLQELLETHLHKYFIIWVLLVWQKSCSMPCYRAYGRSRVMDGHSREIGDGYTVTIITWTWDAG